MAQRSTEDRSLNEKRGTVDAELNAQWKTESSTGAERPTEDRELDRGRNDRWKNERLTEDRQINTGLNAQRNMKLSCTFSPNTRISEQAPTGARDTTLLPTLTNRRSHPEFTYDDHLILSSLAGSDKLIDFVASRDYSV